MSFGGSNITPWSLSVEWFCHPLTTPEPEKKPQVAGESTKLCIGALLAWPTDAKTTLPTRYHSSLLILKYTR